MNKFFKDYKDKVVEWFSGLTEPQQFEVVSGFDHELEDDESPEDYIDSLDGDFLYEVIPGALNRACYTNNGWDQKETVREILMEAAQCDYNVSFADDFVEDMAYNIEGYNDPKGFFEDLQHGGCQSGMIGMFIYNSDCKTFYINNIDDLEEFKSQLEDEFGEPIRNTSGIPHYTFVCWLCYEEFARIIASRLFPDNF